MKTTTQQESRFDLPEEGVTPVSIREIMATYDRAKAEVEAERLAVIARRLFLAVRLCPAGLTRDTLYRLGHKTDIDRCLSVMRGLGWVEVWEQGTGRQAVQIVLPAEGRDDTLCLPDPAPALPAQSVAFRLRLGLNGGAA